MAAKCKEKTFHSVTLGRSLTVSGGYTPTKTFVPDSRMFAFTRGGGDAGNSREEVLECVRLGSRESWLCEMATGQAVFHRPLSRMRVFRMLTKALTTDAGPVDKQMASLAFDDDISEEAETPTKSSAPTRDRKKKSPAVAGMESAATEVCKRVSVPSSPRRPGQLVTVAVALDKQRRLWAHVDALPWLLQYIKEEKEAGGVEPVVSSSVEESQASRVYWNFRDANWIARAKAVDGTWLQTSRGIKRKHKMALGDFQEVKAAAYAELVAWVAKVDNGEITKENQEALE